MMRFRVTFAAAAIVAASGATARDFRESGWACSDFKGLHTLQITNGHVTVNNVDVYEDVTEHAQLPRIVLRISTVNNSGTTSWQFIEFVGYDTDHKTTFAFAMAPSETTPEIEPRATLGSRFGIYEAPGTLEKTKTFCLKMVGSD